MDSSKDRRDLVFIMSPVPHPAVTILTRSLTRGPHKASSQLYV